MGSLKKLLLHPISHFSNLYVSMKFILLYLDPGSGAMIIQALIAGVVGVLMYFKNLKNRILGFFGKKTDADDPSV